MPAAVRWGGRGRSRGTGLMVDGTPNLHRLGRRLRDVPGVSCCSGGVPEGLQGGGGARPMHLNKPRSQITIHQIQPNAHCRFTHQHRPGLFPAKSLCPIGFRVGKPPAKSPPSEGPIGAAGPPDEP